MCYFKSSNTEYIYPDRSLNAKNGFIDLKMSLKKIKKWLGHAKLKKEKDEKLPNRKNTEEAKDLNFGIEFFTNVPAAPVLDPGMDEITITKLTDDYFDKLKENYKEYMENALSGEISDWQNSENPDV